MSITSPLILYETNKSASIAAQCCKSAPILAQFHALKDKLMKLIAMLESINSAAD